MKERLRIKIEELKNWRI